MEIVNWSGFPALYVGQKVVCHNETDLEDFEEGVPYLIEDVTPGYYRVFTGMHTYAVRRTDFHCHFQPITEVDYTILVNQRMLMAYVSSIRTIVEKIQS